MEALLRVLIALFAGGAVDSRPLAVINGGLVNTFNGSLEVLVHRAIENGMANVVTEVERSDEQNIDAWDGSNFINLEWSQTPFLHFLQ